MPGMLAELSKDPTSGFLGYRLTFSGGGPLIVQYWSSHEKLYGYASARDASHRPAWTAFNRRARKSRGAVGIWHETYQVARAETIYAGTPTMGLAKATDSCRSAAEATAPLERLAAGSATVDGSIIRARRVRGQVGLGSGEQPGAARSGPRKEQPCPAQLHRSPTPRPRRPTRPHSRWSRGSGRLVAGPLLGVACVVGLAVIGVWWPTYRRGADRMPTGPPLAPPSPTPSACSSTGHPTGDVRQHRCHAARVALPVLDEARRLATVRAGPDLDEVVHANYAKDHRRGAPTPPSRWCRAVCAKPSPGDTAVAIFSWLRKTGYPADATVSK